MTKKLNAPAIRFKGFSDAWEQRKVQDVADRFDNLRIPVAANLRVHGTTPYYGANGIQDYVEGFTHDGEFVLVAEDGANDLKNYPVKCVNGRIWVNNHAHILQGKAGIADNSFLAFAISQSDIESLLVGGGRAKLNAETLMSIEFRLPCLQEQYRIGEYLTQLDHLITLHQRKFEKLTNVKKSMLEKMFPKNGSSYPEIRFKGFTDPWEQRKLGEVATFINGRAYSQPELLSSGKYKVLRVGNFYTNDSWYYSDLELGEKYYADYGDLLYTWSATFGPHIWLGDRVIYHYHIWKINLSDQLEKQFAVQLLEQDRANILSSKNGSTMVHITKEGMEQKDVIIPPSTKEQQEIGAFFLQLDHLITLHQRKLEKLQNIKKSMLEKMFV